MLCHCLIQEKWPLKPFYRANGAFFGTNFTSTFVSWNIQWFQLLTLDPKSVPLLHPQNYRLHITYKYTTKALTGESLFMVWWSAPEPLLILYFILLIIWHPWFWSPLILALEKRQVRHRVRQVLQTSYISTVTAMWDSFFPHTSFCIYRLFCSLLPQMWTSHSFTWKLCATSYPLMFCVFEFLFK
jgi:hypothetical protein